MPRKRWRCFHCDAVFHSEKQARIHFGYTEMDHPACKLSTVEGSLVDYIRDLERQLDNWRSEGHALFVAAYKLDCEARQLVPDAEQRGYDKGVSQTIDAIRSGALTIDTPQAAVAQ